MLQVQRLSDSYILITFIRLGVTRAGWARVGGTNLSDTWALRGSFLWFNQDEMTDSIHMCFLYLIFISDSQKKQLYAWMFESKYNTYIHTIKQNSVETEF